MKRNVLICAALAVFAFTACGADVPAEEYELTEDAGAFSEQEKQEKYQGYLEKMAEEQLSGMENIDSANAVVAYDKEADAYAIELSLTTIGDLEEEELTAIEEAFGKTYTDVVVYVNGAGTQTQYAQ